MDSKRQTSESELEQWLEAAANRSHLTAEAPKFVVAAVRRAEMDRRNAQLDELLK